MYRFYARRDSISRNSYGNVAGWFGGWLCSWLSDTHRRRNWGPRGPGPPDFFVWWAQCDRAPLTFEKCRPIFELKVTPFFRVNFILSALQTTEWSITEKSAWHNTRRWDSECQQTASSPMIILIDRLRATTTSHQVWRARLFSHCSVCMEQTARRHSRGTWHH